MAPAIPRITCDLMRSISFLTAVKESYVSILEVGTGYGYSTLCLLRGVLEAGSRGKIITIEKASSRANEVSRLIREFGLEDYVEVINSDARDVIPRLQDEFDIVFIDAAKSEYSTYLREIYPKLKIGGVVLAHNVLGFRSVMKEFIQEINNGRRWRTIIYDSDPEGLSISVKIA